MGPGREIYWVFPTLVFYWVGGAGGYWVGQGMEGFWWMFSTPPPQNERDRLVRNPYQTRPQKLSLLRTHTGQQK